MKEITLKITLFVCLFLLLDLPSHAATFTSASTGNWNNTVTWNEPGIPTASDDIFINPGHVVTITGKVYTHNGNIIIRGGGELIVDCGDSNDALIFDGGEFHVFGDLTFTFPDKDLSVVGTSRFWGHPSAVIFISDDWKISGNSNTVVDGICVEVDDDFHINGTNTTLCGGGGVSIGNNTSNTFDLQAGATLGQVCLNTIVYRGVGGNCTTIIGSGTGNLEPVAYDDNGSTYQDTPITIDVLNLSTPDSDPDGDDLKIVAVGQGKLNTGTTQEGGTVSINDNGTSDPTDDFVDYTPAVGFIGTDYFDYVITDENGSFIAANVEVVVTALLPVELASFRVKEAACEINLEWATEAEINSDYFEVQRSEDGFSFTSLGQESAAGFSNQHNIYGFIDALPKASNYYRLKMVDIDGSTEYSDVLFVQSSCVKTDKNIGVVSLFPNPVIYEAVNLRFNANASEEVLLLVSDMYGKNLRAETIFIEKGMNNIPLAVADFRAGTYVVTIGQKAEKFVKLRD